MLALAISSRMASASYPFVGEERLDLVGDHPEQRREALSIMRLSARQDEAWRSAFRIAPGMEPGCETAARSAKRLGLLSPLFMPTAQWCARTTVLSIMSALRSRSTSSASVSSIASKTPVSTQRRYRRKILFHLPYSSGRCRHCAPVRAIHSVPSK